MKVTENNGYKNVKFSTMKPGTSVQVTKTFEEGKEYNGKYGLSYMVGMEYQGDKVSTFMTPKVYAKWQAMPLGPVKVTADSVEMEYTTKEGVKATKWIPSYEFEAVGEDSPSSSSDESTVLSAKQIQVLKAYVENGWHINKEILLTLDNGRQQKTKLKDFLPLEALHNPGMFLQ